MKTFLRNGHAEEYQGIKITWIPGREAVLTIFHDGKEVEKVELFKTKTIEELHALVQSKGFKKKSEIQVIQEQRREEELKRLDTKPIQSTMIQLYGLLLLGFVATMVFFGTRHKRRKARGGIAGPTNSMGGIPMTITTTSMTEGV